MSPHERSRLVRDLSLLFAVALGLRLFWAALTPPWMAPDEQSHFTYISHIVENGQIPHPDRWDARYPNQTVEFEQSCFTTLCFRISGLGRGPGELKYYPYEHDYGRARALVGKPEERRSASGASATPYPPLYYLMGSIPYRLLYSSPILTRVLAVRALSAFLSAWGCVFGFLFAFELRRDLEWGRAIGLCLALMPMHAFIGASVNNDALMFAATSALCWLMARAFQRGVDACIAGAFGLVGGIALLSKPTSAPVVLFAGICLVWFAVPSLAALRGLRLAQLKNVFVFVAGLLLTEGVWIVYRRANAVHQATVAPGQPGTLKILLGQGPFSWWDYAGDLYARGFLYYDWLFMRTFWGCFGWLELFFSDTTYLVIYSLGLAACGGLVWRAVRKPEERKMLVALSVGVVANVVLLFMSADYVMSFATRGRTFGMQGRYFYGTLAPHFFLLASGVAWLFRDRAFVIRLIPLPMLVLHGLSILRMLNAYYGLTVW